MRDNYEEPAVVRAPFVGAGERRIGEDVAGVDGAIAPGAVHIGAHPNHETHNREQHHHVRLHLAASTARLVDDPPRRPVPPPTASPRSPTPGADASPPHPGRFQIQSDSDYSWYFFFHDIL